MALIAASPACAGVEQWRSLIEAASARSGVPASWIEQVMHSESRGNVAAVSSKGALGLMQLMPQTWNELRFSLALGPDPFEPSDNILAGAFYLRSMYEKFGYPGLFAAYNAGPRRYAEHLSGGRRLPIETRAYVEAVSGRRAAIIASPLPFTGEFRRNVAPRKSSLFFELSAPARQ